MPLPSFRFASGPATPAGNNYGYQMGPGGVPMPNNRMLANGMGGMGGMPMGGMPMGGMPAYGAPQRPTADYFNSPQYRAMANPGPMGELFNPYAQLLARQQMSRQNADAQIAAQMPMGGMPMGGMGGMPMGGMGGMGGMPMGRMPMGGMGGMPMGGMPMGGMPMGRMPMGRMPMGGMPMGGMGGMPAYGAPQRPSEDYFNSPQYRAMANPGPQQTANPVSFASGWGKLQRGFRR